MRKFRHILFTIAMFVLPAVVHGQARFQIEVPYEAERNQIFVTATVDGIEGRYIFDTGAPAIVTHSRFQKGYDQIVNQAGVTDAHGNEAQYKVASFGSFKLGGYNIKGVQAIVMDENNIMEKLGVDGIVGNNMFPGCTVRFDSKRKVIIIASDTGYFDINPRNYVPMEVIKNNYHTYINIRLGNGVMERVMFDTGSPMFFELKKESYDELLKQSLINIVDTGYGSTGMGVIGAEGNAARERIAVCEMRIGTGKFKNVTTETMTGPTSRIGAPLINHGYVTIDYGTHSFYFEPFESGPVDMYRKGWEVDIILSDDHLEAGVVWSGMQGEVEAGDRVVEINGIRYEKVSAEEFLQKGIVNKLEGDEAEIVVRKKNGEEKKVIMKKR